MNTQEEILKYITRKGEVERSSLLGHITKLGLTIYPGQLGDMIDIGYIKPRYGRAKTYFSIPDKKVKK